MTLVLKPDPKPELNRAAFADTWSRLQLLKQPALETLAQIGQVERSVLDISTDGEAPAAWCVICNAPLFEDDDIVADPAHNDAIACRHEALAVPGRCFRDLMEG